MREWIQVTSYPRAFTGFEHVSVIVMTLTCPSCARGLVDGGSAT